MPVEYREEKKMKSKFVHAWKLLPKVLRKTIVLLIGSTLILTGLLLIVLRTTYLAATCTWAGYFGLGVCLG